MKKSIFVILLVIISISTVLAAYTLIAKTRSNFDDFYSSFNNLSSEKKYETIISLRDIGINNAIARGDYRCCIDPPCTMCYMEANKWNNFTAGTCACDDLIARGEEACPQCKRGLDTIHAEDNTFCDIDAKTANCESISN